MSIEWRQMAETSDRRSAGSQHGETRRLSSNRILGLIENGIEAEKCKRDESAGMRKSRILTPTHLPDVPKTQTSRQRAGAPFAVLKMFSHPLCECRCLVLAWPGEEGHAEEGIAL
jgi:hypothetical protein